MILILILKLFSFGKSQGGSEKRQVRSKKSQGGSLKSQRVGEMSQVESEK
jgi:hypothetical protein